MPRVTRYVERLATLAPPSWVTWLWRSLRRHGRQLPGLHKFCPSHRKHDSMNLINRKALVTGAARGIGRGCALALARAGADVAINDRERSAEAQSVVAEIEALGR